MKRHETVGEKRARVLRGKLLLKKLKRLIPDAGMMLTFKNEWELLVAVELSAQCTDKKVNEITPALFARYPTLDDYVHADPREFEQMIFQSGFYRNKTKNILAAALMVKQVFHGVLPKTMKEMLLIPGVARKPLHRRAQGKAAGARGPRERQGRGRGAPARRSAPAHPRRAAGQGRRALRRHRPERR